MALREHWALDPDVVFLNHGSFGACPRAVLAVQAEWRAMLEREPVQFFSRLLAPELDRVRERVGAFVGAAAENVAFVPNSTTAVSAVLRSLEWAPGDVILTTNHAYAACANAMRFIADGFGVRVVAVDIPLPVAGPDEVVGRIVQEIPERTRLAVLDHVTSPTGLVFPIERIVRELRERGVETLVDGAHVPGMLALDVERLGAAYYVGNFHKWVCAPKGAAMLWVRPDRQKGLHPGTISHGYGGAGPRSRFLEEFDWTGTTDPSAWLSVPAAIDFVGGLLPGGWPSVYETNRALALRARSRLGEALRAAPLAPDAMIGSLAALPVPDAAPGASSQPADDPLHRRLFERHRVEVPVFTWPAPPRRLLRVSAHLYNTEADVERLAKALAGELGAGGPGLG